MVYGRVKIQADGGDGGKEVGKDRDNGEGTDDNHRHYLTTAACNKFHLYDL